VSERATDVDRAFAAIGARIPYISFGRRRPPETSPELREIFSYSEQGEGVYRAPPEPVVEELPPLAGLPGSVEPPVEVLPVTFESVPTSESVAEPESVPVPVYAPAIASQPVAQPIAEPSPALQPVFVPLASRFAAAQQAPQPELPPAPTVSNGFGLPELWRDHGEASVGVTASVAEQRALAAMFRMLGNKANLPSSGGVEPEEQNSRVRNDLFRRL
jgi:hypothetical protein